jgi:hypothetical protein
VAERLRASVVGETVPLHRLTQPVPRTVDRGRVAIRHRPRRALAVSRILSTRLAPLEAACRARGIALTVIGADGRETDDPEIEMMRADMVFGSGRTIVEAMALGRAACVYDELGIGGWVTPDSYDELESRGFTPRENDGLSVDELLDGYRRELGSFGRDRATTSHAAPMHAATLVEIYRSAALASSSPATPATDRLGAITQELFEAQLRARRARWDLVAAERQNERLREELDAIRRSNSWRVTRPLRWLRRREPHPDDAEGES